MVTALYASKISSLEMFKIWIYRCLKCTHSLEESCPLVSRVEVPLGRKAYVVSQSQIADVHRKMEVGLPARNRDFYKALEPWWSH